MKQRKIIVSLLSTLLMANALQSREQLNEQIIASCHQMIASEAATISCNQDEPCSDDHICCNHRQAFASVLYRITKDIELGEPDNDAFLLSLLRSPLEVDGAFTQFNGDVYINDDADSSHAINIGTGGGTSVKEVTIGSIANNSYTLIQGGTGGVFIDTVGAGEIRIGDTSGSVSISAGDQSTTVHGSLTVAQLTTCMSGAEIVGDLTQSGGGAVSIGDGDDASTTISIGAGATGGTGKIITIGSTTGNSSTIILGGNETRIDSGTDVTIGANSASVSLGGMDINTIINGPLIVNDTHTANAGAEVFGAFNQSGGDVNINNDSENIDRVINIGTGAGTSSKTIIIGNGANATSIAIEAGTGHAILDANAGEVFVGATNATAVHIGTMGANTTINGSLVVSDSLSVGQGASIMGNFTQVGGSTNLNTDSAGASINIGTGVGSMKTVVIGSTSSSSSTALNAGSGGISIDTANGMISIGATNTIGIEIANTGVDTTVNGNLLVDKALIVVEGISSTGDLTQTGGNVSLNNDNADASVLIGTGSVNTIKSVTIGSMGSASQTTINAGTAGIAIDAASGPITLGAGTANGLSLGRSGVATTIIGPLRANQLVTCNAGETVTGTFTHSGGAASFHSGASMITFTSTNVGNDAIKLAGNTRITGSLNLQSAFTIDSSITITADGLNVQSGDATISNGALTQAGGAVTLNAGINKITLTSANAAQNAIQLAGKVTVPNALVQSGGDVTLSDDADAATIKIGTGMGAKTVMIGSSTGASALDLQAGTGTVNIATTPQARTINIGTGNANQMINIGNHISNPANTITIGGGSNSSIAITGTLTHNGSTMINANGNGTTIIGGSGTGGVAIQSAKTGADAILLQATTSTDNTSINLVSSNGGITATAASGKSIVLQTSGAGTVSISNNATIGGTLASGLITANGGLSVTGALTQSGGALSLTSSVAGTVDSMAALGIGAVHATSVNVGNASSLTSILGAPVNINATGSNSTVIGNNNGSSTVTIVGGLMSGTPEPTTPPSIVIGHNASTAGDNATLLIDICRNEAGTTANTATAIGAQFSMAGGSQFIIIGGTNSAAVTGTTTTLVAEDSATVIDAQILSVPANTLVAGSNSRTLTIDDGMTYMAPNGNIILVGRVGPMVNFTALNGGVLAPATMPDIVEFGALVPILIADAGISGAATIESRLNIGTLSPQIYGMVTATVNETISIGLNASQALGSQMITIGNNVMTTSAATSTAIGTQSSTMGGTQEVEIGTVVFGSTGTSTVRIATGISGAANDVTIGTPATTTTFNGSINAVGILSFPIDGAVSAPAIAAGQVVAGSMPSFNGATANCNAITNDGNGIYTIHFSPAFSVIYGAFATIVGSGNATANAGISIVNGSQIQVFTYDNGNFVNNLPFSFVVYGHSF